MSDAGVDLTDVENLGTEPRINLNPQADEFAARIGNLGSGQMSVRAILYLTAGHEVHHRVLLRDRYLPCINSGMTANR